MILTLRESESLAHFIIELFQKKSKQGGGGRGVEDMEFEGVSKK